MDTCSDRHKNQVENKQLVRKTYVIIQPTAKKKIQNMKVRGAFIPFDLPREKQLSLSFPKTSYNTDTQLQFSPLNY